MFVLLQIYSGDSRQLFISLKITGVYVILVCETNSMFSYLVLLLVEVMSLLVVQVFL